MLRTNVLFTLLSVMIAASAAAGQESDSIASKSSSPAESSAKEWHFIISGDSRNCGDLVMPAIASDAAQYHPTFYWRLGDPFGK